MRTVPILLVLGILGAGAAAVQVGACGSAVGSKAAGEACHGSSECGPDLVCDFSKEPAICAQQGAPPADADYDAGPADARGPDAKPGTPDASPPDASPPDADVVDAMDVDAMPDA